MSRKVFLPSISILRSLRDATTFAFTHPHLLMDAGGFNIFMKAFFAVIRGEAVPPLMLDDPFTPFFTTQVKTKAITLRQDGHFMDLQN